MNRRAKMCGRTEFVVSIVSVNGKDEVEIRMNGNKVKGGVKAKAGHKVRWERDKNTVDTFSLEFFRLNSLHDAILEDIAEVQDRESDWPFDKYHAKKKSIADVDEVFGIVDTVESFSGRLAPVEETTAYKYTVRAKKGTSPEAVLDPPIIIEPY
jgi:hypothetical protein